MNDIFELTKKYKKSLISPNDITAFTNIEKEIKSSIDRYYLLAYYNQLFNLPNFNKLILDYDSVSDQGKCFLVGFALIDENIESQKNSEVTEFAKKIKDKYAKYLAQQFIYFDDCYFFLITSKQEKADYLRRSLKKELFKDKFKIFSYYSEITKEKSKTIKNIYKAKNDIMQNYLEAKYEKKSN